MTKIILFLLLAIQCSAGIDPLVTRKANLAKERAEKAIVDNNYDGVIKAYNYLLDTLKINDDQAVLNLAHAYMRKADYSNALNRYNQALKATDHRIKSIASQQLGILQSEKGNREEAQELFKNAIRLDPSNTQARFNYELMLKNKNKEIPKSQDKKQRQEEEKKKEEQKKKEEEKKKDEEKNNKEPGKGDKDEDSEKKKGSKESDKGKEGEKEEKEKNDKGKSENNKEGKDNQEKNSEKEKENKEKGDKSTKNKKDEESKEKGEAEKPTDKGDKKKNQETPGVSVNKEQLKKMNMTEQQAKSLLNAMRQGEVQYLQQMKRSSGKGNDKNKKDW